MNYQTGYRVLFAQVTDLLSQVQLSQAQGQQAMKLEDLAFYLKVAQARAEEGILQEEE